MDVDTLIAQSQIQRLIHVYAQAADSQDVDGIVACFAPDGCFELNNGAVVLEGRAAPLLSSAPATAGAAAIDGALNRAATELRRMV